MRPIYWGTIWVFIGMIGWVVFSIVGGTIEGLGGERNQVIFSLVYFFGFLYILSLPVAIICEFIRWIKNRRKKSKNVESEVKRD